MRGLQRCERLRIERLGFGTARQRASLNEAHANRTHGPQLWRRLLRERGETAACEPIRYNSYGVPTQVSAGDMTGRSHPDNDISIMNCTTCGHLPNQHAVAEAENHKARVESPLALSTPRMTVQARHPWPLRCARSTISSSALAWKTETLARNSHAGARQRRVRVRAVRRGAAGEPKSGRMSVRPWSRVHETLTSVWRRRRREPIPDCVRRAQTAEGVGGGRVCRGIRREWSARLTTPSCAPTVPPCTCSSSSTNR